LAYFGLSLDEGPSIDGNFGPYVQSERYQIYKNEVERLIEENKAYKCFCSVEVFFDFFGKNLMVFLFIFCFPGP